MSSIEQRLAILVCAEERDRGEHGIMFAPAHGIDADTVNAMARHGRGLVACCLEPYRAWELGLTTMARTSWRADRPRFLTSVEAAACDGTGISAADRALTLRVLGDPASRCADLRSPGHVMPCIASDADAPLSAAALAITDTDAVAWCSILNDHGDLASRADCVALGQRLGIPVRVMGPIRRAETATHERAAIDWGTPAAWCANSNTLLRGDLMQSGWL